MAEVNYINPGALLGDSGWKPQGFLGGVMYGQNRDMGKQMFDLQKLISVISAQKQGAELADYQAAAPFRQADRQFKMDKFPHELAQIQGTNTKQNLENLFTSATQPSKINTTLAENSGKISDVQMRQLEQSIGLTQMIATLTAPDKVGPHTIPMISQMVQQSGMDSNHPVLRALLNNPDPRAINKNATQLFQVLNETNEKFRLERMKGQMDYKRAMDVQGLANQGSLATANARAQAKNKSAKQILMEAAAKGPMQAWTEAQAILSDAEIDPALRAKAQELKNRVEPAVQEILRKGQTPNFDPNNPGPIAVPRPNLDPQPKPQPHQGDLPRGVTKGW